MAFAQCSRGIWWSRISRSNTLNTQQTSGRHQRRLFGRKCRRSVVSMTFDQKNCEDEKSEPSSTQHSHVTVEIARKAFDDAISQAGDDVHAVAEKCATGFIDAYRQCCSPDEDPSVFVVCGPGLTGLIGLYIARALATQGYNPAVYAGTPSKHVDITSFCENHSLPLFDFVPSTMEFHFQGVIDALVGVGFDGGDIRQPYWQIQEMLVTTRLPIASVDVPSGWDLTTGPRPIDVTADTFIKPHLLVSLGAPLPCTVAFAGEYHFVAGRHLPEGYYANRGISVPSFPGEAHSVLFGSTLKPYVGNGAVYGRPGQFNATLFTKNPRREWVDIEDEMDLWDELD